MCGILGVTNNNVNLDCFKSALEKLNHRGPDGDGIYQDQKLFLGHKRLSIIDVRNRADQPMVSECGNYVLVYNGEIYNYKELSKKYLSDQRFKSYSDTEVLLYLLIEKGKSIIRELDGIFSFAFYSILDNELLLARDRFGIKPLYYNMKEGASLCFSSEIKGIHAIVGEKELNEEQISEQIMFGYIAGEKTLFKNIKRLLPGYIMEFNVITCEKVTYSYYDKNVPIELSSERRCDVLNKVNSLLIESVNSQTMSDVPIGVMLSGGLDSSMLSSISSMLIKDINSFTISLTHEKYDEASYAKILAKDCSLTYNELKYQYADFDALFSKLTYFHDEPLRHINSLPIYSITKLARDKGVKVLLAGEGADEIFGGYGVYLKIKTKIFLSKLTYFVPDTIMKFMTRSGRFTFLNKSEDINTLNNYLVYSRAVISIKDFKKISKTKIDISFREHIASEAMNIYKKDGINAMMHVDQNIHLQSLLDRQDKMSMAASVECRVPFLSNEIPRYLNNLKSNNKVYKGSTKILLREVSKLFLPSKLVKREKHPFGLPLYDQLKSSAIFNHFVQDFENSEVVKKNIINSHFSKNLKKFINGDLVNADLIYNIFSLEIWLKLNF